MKTTRVRTLHEVSGIKHSDTMTNQVNILFSLRKARGGKSYHLQLRVTVNGQREQIKALGIEILKKDWDSIRHRIKGNDPDVRTKNMMLSTIESDLNNIVLDFEVKKNS